MGKPSCGDGTSAQHRVGNKQIRLDAILDASNKSMTVIYLLGSPKPEYGDEILVPRGRSMKRSALIAPRLRRLRAMGEMAGESRSDRHDPSMG